MVAGRPYYQRYHADFIMGVRGFDLETVGAYSLIIDHLNDRDRPLPDDDRFMAGLLHCSPQRWRKIRAALIRAQKIVITDDQYITNPRWERDKAKRRGDLEAAERWGRAGGLIAQARRAGQEEMDLDAGWDDQPPRAHARTDSADSGETSAKLSQKSSKSSGDQSADQKQKPSKIKASAQPPPQAPCAREESRDQNQRLSSHPNRRVTDSRGAIDDQPLDAICEAVCEAAGHRPGNPEQRARAMRHCAEWQALGISFDRVVLPTIRAFVSRTDQPTRTLGRFKAQIALEHAKAEAGGVAPYDPPRPLNVKDDPDPRVAQLRDRLRKTLGARTYDGWLRPVAISINGTGLIVTAPSQFMADWVRTHFSSELAKAGGVERVEVKTV